jgi:hypothetical protein
VGPAELQQGPTRPDGDVVAVGAEQQHPVQPLGEQAQHSRLTDNGVAMWFLSASLLSA